MLISSCDVWLNTPIVGFEACGTSGMKAAMNGVLPFSTKDGWVDRPVRLFMIPYPASMFWETPETDPKPAFSSTARSSCA